MRRFRIALLAAAFVGLATSSAHAGLMPVSATMTPETGNNLYSYNVGLESGSVLKSGDYFTIYDVAGYVGGSATTPTGWTLTSSSIGQTPANLAPIDSGSVPNLTFTYTGTTPITTAGSVGNFTFNATSTPTPTFFASQTHTATNGIEGNVTTITATTTSPGSPQTPEPATILLLGMALPLAGMRRWLSRKE